MRRTGRKTFRALVGVASAILMLAPVVILVQAFWPHSGPSNSAYHKSFAPIVASQVPTETPTDIPTPEPTPTQAPTPTPIPTPTPLNVQIVPQDLGGCRWTLTVTYPPDSTLHIRWSHNPSYGGTSVTVKAPFTITVTVTNDQISGSASVSKTCP